MEVAMFQILICFWIMMSNEECADDTRPKNNTLKLWDDQMSDEEESIKLNLNDWDKV